MDADEKRQVMMTLAGGLGDVPPVPTFNAWEAARVDAEMDALREAGRPVPDALLQQWVSFGRAHASATLVSADVPLTACPSFQVLAAKRVNQLREQVEAGDGVAVIEALACCAMHGLVAPGWLAAEFVGRFDRVAVGDVKTWDDKLAFGPAVPQGTNIAGVRAVQQKAPEAHRVALGLLAGDPSRPIDKGFYEEVGEAIEVGATQAEALISKYVESGQGTWPAPGALKPYLRAADGDLYAAWSCWHDHQMLARWCNAGGTREQWQEDYGRSLSQAPGSPVPDG